MLGGDPAEARVVSGAVRLETATRIDRRIQIDLLPFHQLLTLHNVGDPEALETALFAVLHLESPEVEVICLLPELLDDLLRSIGLELDIDGVSDDFEPFAA